VLFRSYAFDWFIGTSAGAIAAALLGAGYNRKELEELLRKKQFTDFLDAPFYMAPINLLFHKGLYHARSLTSWIDTLIAQKLNSVTRVKFRQLPHRVTIYASRRGQKALVFDSLNPKTSDMAVSHAVRCSISIPLIFVPAREEGLRVFDGGLQNNYPVDHLLAGYPDTKFIGLYLGAEVFEGEERDPSLFTEILSIWSESNDTAALERYQEETIIIDPRPISTTDFKLTEFEKEFLICAGEAAALKFIAKQRFSNGPTLDELESSQRRVAQVKAAMFAHRRRWWFL